MIIDVVTADRAIHAATQRKHDVPELVRRPGCPGVEVGEYTVRVQAHSRDACRIIQTCSAVVDRCSSIAHARAIIEPFAIAVLIEAAEIDGLRNAGLETDNSRKLPSAQSFAHQRAMVSQLRQ